MVNECEIHRLICANCSVISSIISCVRQREFIKVHGRPRSFIKSFSSTLIQLPHVSYHGLTPTLGHLHWRPACSSPRIILPSCTGPRPIHRIHSVKIFYQTIALYICKENFGIIVISNFLSDIAGQKFLDHEYTYGLRVKKFKLNTDIRSKLKKTLYLFIKYKKKKTKHCQFEIFTIEKKSNFLFIKETLDF